jgi:hypothetical protein
MKRRIFLWVLVGLLVGGVWVAYAFATAPDVEVHRSVGDRAVQIFAYVTCPIIATGLNFYWLPLTNAASYALLGFLWESVNRN